MKLDYLGHSSFKITNQKGKTLITDPYIDIGYQMPNISADYVAISHSHYDHNAKGCVFGNPFIIDSPKQLSKDDFEVVGFSCFHDENKGKERGDNIIFKIIMDDIVISHLGDIGQKINEDILKFLINTNVLLIPTGGRYTINANSAKEYVDKVKPNIVIPMHYKTKDLNIDIDKVDKFTNLFDKNLITYIKSSIEIEPKSFTKLKIIVIDRLKD